MIRLSPIERQKMIRYGGRDIRNRTYTDHSKQVHIHIWISDAILSLGHKCQTQQQRLAKRFKELTRGDQEAYARHSEEYRKSVSLIELKKKRLDETYEPHLPGTEDEPEEVRMQLDAFDRADNEKTRRELKKDIESLEERLIQLTEALNVIERRVRSLQEDLYNLMVMIEHKFDTLMSVYHGAARKVYCKEKLTKDPPMPEEPPTVEKLRQAGLVAFNVGEWAHGLLLAQLSADQPDQPALLHRTANNAQLPAPQDIDDRSDPD